MCRTTPRPQLHPRRRFPPPPLSPSSATPTREERRSAGRALMDGLRSSLPDCGSKASTSLLPWKPRTDLGTPHLAPVWVTCSLTRSRKWFDRMTASSVIFGSGGDPAVPPEQLQPAVRQTLDAVRAAAPKAKVVVIGPACDESRPDARYFANPRCHTNRSRRDGGRLRRSHSGGLVHQPPGSDRARRDHPHRCRARVYGGQDCAANRTAAGPKPVTLAPRRARRCFR